MRKLLGPVILIIGVALIMAAGIYAYMNFRSNTANPVVPEAQPALSNSGQYIEVAGQQIALEYDPNQRLIIEPELPPPPTAVPPTPTPQVIPPTAVPEQQPTQPAEIPTATPEPAQPAFTEDCHNHVIEPGETLASLAAINGISVPLMNAGGITADMIYTGNTVCVPATHDADGDGRPNCAQLGLRERVVNEGERENVFRIAQEFGVTEDAIRDLNGLNAFYTVYVGQKLCIPNN